MKLAAIIGSNARRFLTAMLQRVQAKRGDRGRVLTSENAEHAAFIMEMIVGFRRGEVIHAISIHWSLRPDFVSRATLRAIGPRRCSGRYLRD
ncbi:MAG: hypothetical protein Rhirs2KO_16590 [Rhizobiaceae bacterium]